MKKRTFRTLSLGICMLLLIEVGRAQDNWGNVLYGDLYVEGTTSEVTVPHLFHVILYFVDGQVIGRQPVSAGGRYRFNSVRNGEYVLVVELDGNEVARMKFLVSETRRTDIKRDITLQWAEKGRRAENTTVSIADTYARSSGTKAKFEKAQDAVKSKDYAQAVLLFKQVVTDDPKDYVAHTELGTVFFILEKLDDAEKSYLQALEQKPDFILALLNMGKLRVAKKNFDSAIEFLTQAVQTEPRSADANYYLGEAYLQVKKGSKAVGFLNEAIKLDPVGKAEAHLRLAALYNAAGLKDKAALEYEQFLAKKPDYSDKKKLEKYISDNKKK
jgi:tetratricopeptide (TPR) repeat protein